MKKTLMKQGPAFMIALAFVAFAPSAARAQSTTFTYQGSLNDAGTPSSGLHDFQFRLFDASSGGAQIGSTICVDDVNVAAGVFTVPLDFGPQYATTAQRYLEISVRKDTGLTCPDATGFVLMTPRQLLTAAPMASHANSAFALDAADGSPTNAVYVDNSGKVGVGTTSPTGPLHIKTSAPYLILQDTASPANQVGYLTFYDANSIETGWMGFGSPSTSDFFLVNARSGGDMLFYAGGLRTLTLSRLGRLGIGTSAPSEKLDVHGNIKLGANSEYYATGGATPLRVIRGRVTFSGGISYGEGFTVVKASTGVYNLTWSPAFSATPVVTASAEYNSGGARLATINGATTIATTIRITNGSNTAVDEYFYFTAIGPQ